MNHFAAASIALLTCVTGARGAEAIAVTNAGFEDPVIATEGGFVSPAPAWSPGQYDVTAPTVWIPSAPPTYVGAWNPDASEYLAGAAPEGQNMGFTTAVPGYDVGMSQVLSSTLQADATYGLSVVIGNPVSYNAGLTADYRIELLAGGVVLQSATGASPTDGSTFTTATLTYGSGATPAQLGQPLEIRILAVNFTEGLEVDCDDVQLTVTLTNPAADPGGPYSVSLGGLLSLNGGGSLPSDGQAITLYEWDIDNDGTFDFTGVTPAAITYDDLQTTYGMIVGANTIKLRVTDDSAPTPKTSTAEGTVTLMPPVNTFTSSAVRPTFDGADLGYLNPNTPSTAPGQDKWFYENSGAGQCKGQTFTLTSDVLLKAVTYRLGSTNKPATVDYLLRIGAIDTATNTFYPLHETTITQTTDWGEKGVTTDSYGTWTLGTPVALPALPAGTLYGFDLTMTANDKAWQLGIPYPKYENTNVFADGNKYTTPLGGAAGIPTNTMQMDSGRDREFHIDMDAITIEDTTPPTLAAIADNASGGPIYADQVQLIYTLTFDERIDETTIDLADFENLGTGVGIDSVVSVTQTTPYPVPSVINVVFGISGTGTLQLGVKSGSDIADIAGNPVVSPVVDDTTITVNSGTNPAGGNRWWDGLTTSGITDGVSQGGDGTWDTTTTSWDRGFGFANPVAWNNSNNDPANFGGTAGTVTVAEPISLSDMTFNLAGQYTVDGGTLNFAPGSTIRTNDNRYDQTITSAITGSPAVETKDFGAGNQYKGLIFAPASGTQTLGDILNPNNTGNTDKAGVAFAGSTTGNSVASINYAGGDRYGTIYLQSGEWSIPGGIRTGTVRISGGTFTLGGTVQGDYNGYDATGGTAKGVFTILSTDRRTTVYMRSGSTIAPGNSVGTVTVDWTGTQGINPGENDYSLWLQNGSTYEWEVGPGNTTDTIHLVEGRLYVDDMTLKIIDAGGTPAGTDQLPVFTYDAGVAIDITGFTGTFDTSALGPEWTIGTLALTDDGAGIISLTGLSKAAGSNNFVNWIARYPGVGAKTGFTDDPDADGNDNGLENFFGTDPSVFTTGLIGGAKDSDTFTFTHPQNATPADDITAAYSWSTDLATFTADGVTDGNGTTVTFSPAVDTPVAGTTTVTATITGTSIDKLFVRVTATQN